MNFIQDFKFDFWTLWGITAQFLFFSRFVLQWYISEKKKRSIIPKGFWHISIAGATMIFIYAIIRRDLVFLIMGFLQIFIYTRNVFLERGGILKK